jgi:hypothetical protein
MLQEVRMPVCYVTRGANYIPACGQPLGTEPGVCGTNSLKEVTCPGCLCSDEYLATGMERALIKSNIRQATEGVVSMFGTDMYER